MLKNLTAFAAKCSRGRGNPPVLPWRRFEREGTVPLIAFRREGGRIFVGGDGHIYKSDPGCRSGPGACKSQTQAPLWSRGRPD